MILRTTAFLLSLIVSASTVFGQASFSEVETQLLKEAEERNVDEQLALLNDAIVNYNSVAVKNKKIIDTEIQISVNSGSKVVLPSILLRDGTECVAKVYQRKAFAVNNTGVWKHLLFGMTEQWFNNQYYAMELNCTSNQILALVQTVDGQDPMDYVNPLQNSGSVTYSIKQLETNL